MLHYYAYVIKLLLKVSGYFRSFTSLEIFMDAANLTHLSYFIIILVFTTLTLLIRKKFLSNGKSIKEVTYKDIVQEIHYAACYCKDNPSLIPRCMKLLSKYPQMCNVAMPEHNYTPFLRACWNGCPELISYMLQRGADKTSTTDAGEGGIYLAAYCMIRRNETSFKSLQILISAGLDINQARHDGYTALHLAAYRGHSKLVRWLLAHGANPELKGRPSAFKLALAGGYPKVAFMLRLPDVKEHL